MAEVEKFDIWRQREILTDIADNGAEVLHTAEGAAFIEQLDSYFASSLVGLSRARGYAALPDEIVNLIIERLMSTRSNPERCPARYAAGAEDPWGYLWKCGKRWVEEMGGRRGIPLEYVEYEFEAEQVEEELELTPLAEVVDLTFAQVAPVIPEKHHSAVLELLNWLAANPAQRRTYDDDDRRAAHRFCPSLSTDQVIAVMKIARGSRPREAETSLMFQYLLDAHFRVSDHPTLARALIHFKNEFRAGETGSRLLSNW